MTSHGGTTATQAKWIELDIDTGIRVKYIIDVLLISSQ